MEIKPLDSNLGAKFLDNRPAMAAKPGDPHKSVPAEFCQADSIPNSAQVTLSDASRKLLETERTAVLAAGEIPIDVNCVADDVCTIAPKKNKRSHIFLCENHADYRAKSFTGKLIKLLGEEGLHNLSLEMSVDMAENIRQDKSYNKGSLDQWLPRANFNNITHEFLSEYNFPEKMLSSPEKVEITLTYELGYNLANGMTKKILADFLQNAENKLYGIDILSREMKHLDVSYCLRGIDYALGLNELCIEKIPRPSRPYDSFDSSEERILYECAKSENINYEKIYSILNKYCDLSYDDYVDYMKSIEKGNAITQVFRDKKIVENIISTYENNDKMIYWMGKDHCNDVVHFLKEKSDVLMIDTVGNDNDHFHYLPRLAEICGTEDGRYLIEKLSREAFEQYQFDKENYFQCEDRNYDNCAKNIIELV